MIRLVVRVYCDALNCKRYTEATIFDGKMYRVGSSGTRPSRTRDIEFPSSPAGEPSGWIETDTGETFCPDHKP